MVNFSTKDKNGKTVKKSDAVYYGSNVWTVDRIVNGKLHLSRFGISTVANSKDVVKYR